MTQRCKKCSLFFVDIPQQVLVKGKLTMLNCPDTKEDDWAGKKAQCLDVEKDEVVRLVETRSPQHERMGFWMAAADQVHDIRRISGGQAADNLMGFRPELRVTGEVGQCPEPPGVQPLPGCLPDAADKSEVPEQFFPEPVEIECPGTEETGGSPVRSRCPHRSKFPCRKRRFQTARPDIVRGWCRAYAGPAHIRKKKQNCW